MKTDQILNDLNAITLTGEAAKFAARTLYLTWLLHIPAGQTAAAAACAALSRCTTRAPSEATIAFVDYLHQTARTAPHSPTRCGGRSRRARVLN